MVIEITNKKSKNVVISAQYRKPAGDFKQYKTYLKNLFNKIYIIGDTNLNLTDFEKNIKVENYLNLLFQKNVIFAS